MKKLPWAFPGSPRTAPAKPATQPAAPKAQKRAKASPSGGRVGGSPTPAPQNATADDVDDLLGLGTPSDEDVLAALRNKGQTHAAALTGLKAASAAPAGEVRTASGIALVLPGPGVAPRLKHKLGEITAKHCYRYEGDDHWHPDEDAAFRSWYAHFSKHFPVEAAMLRAARKASNEEADDLLD